MSWRVQLMALLSLAGVIAVASALAGGSSQPFKRSSVLHGKTVLTLSNQSGKERR